MIVKTVLSMEKDLQIKLESFTTEFSNCQSTLLNPLLFRGQ